MANLLLTNICNRNCSFCFAGSRVYRGGGEGGDDRYMSRETLRRVMRFLSATGERQLRLLGGEPTLHPEFIEIVEEALRNGFHVHLFSNGMMKKEIADFLGRRTEDEVTFLCNISPQAEDTASNLRKREYALRQLGKKAQVGMTITEPEFDLEPLIEAIRAFGLRERIRIGIAQPIVGKDNRYLLPSEYRRAGKAIVAAAGKCIERGILLGFDCGLTLCMFDEAEIGYLMKHTEGFVMRCNPILDIGSDLDVWHCFPLSEVLNTNLTRFPNRNEIVSYYKKIMNPYRILGCKPECMRCVHLHRGQCTGGCLAHAMKALDRLPPRQGPAPRQDGAPGNGPDRER